MTKTKRTKILFAIMLLIPGLISCTAEKSARGTMDGGHSDHEDHLAKVNQQGDEAMGFSHKKTKHRFILLKDGGAIQITVNDKTDTESLAKIRKHLGEIPKMFAEGNFEHPIMTHGKVPMGVPVMKELKSEIQYKYADIENGGRVLISTKNEKALEAIHKFLRFQIEDHQTGDPTEISDGLD